MATVTDLKQGQKGIIRDFLGTALPIKLLELGCLPGNLVELIQTTLRLLEILIPEKPLSLANLPD